MVRRSPSRSSVPQRRRAVLVALLLVGVLAVTVAYLRVGWWRMESACSLEGASGSTQRSVSYGWSWQPPGFRCTYGDGVTATSLWF